MDNVGGSSITPSTGNAIPGNSITYTVVATNKGPNDVTGANVVDTFPAGVTSDSWTAVATGGASGFSAAGNGNINDLAVNLPAGSTVTYTVTANISPTATGVLSNTATITPPLNITDPTPGNNSATDTDTLTPTADLKITKVDNRGGSSITSAVGNVGVGQSLVYTIVATNVGPMPSPELRSPTLSRPISAASVGQEQTVPQAMETLPTQSRLPRVPLSLTRSIPPCCRPRRAPR